MTNLSAIQAALREENLDGWLFFDHHLRDPLALHHHLQGQHFRQGRMRRPACSPERRIAGIGGGVVAAAFH